MTEPEIRQAIVQACRAMNATRLNQGMAGNISVRLGEVMFITPTATPYDQMQPGDIAMVALADPDGAYVGPLRPSSEWRFHRDILRARPEFSAVVHAHSPYCTGLSIARLGIPACHYMVASFGGDDVRCAPYETFGTAALSRAVLGALAERSACLMANHGMLACGQDLAQAMWRAVELEALARQYILAQQAGGAVLLSRAEIAAAEAMFASYRPK